MDWLHGPVNEIFGIPTCWIARIGKVFQFVSGTVIVLDIVGPDRVEDWANSVREQLTNLADTQPLKSIATSLWKTVRSFLSYFFTWPSTEREKEELRELVKSKYDWLARCVWLALTVIMIIVAIVYLILNRGWVWSLFLYIPLALVASALISLLLTYLVVFNLLLILFIVVVRPIELVFDILARGVVGVLRRKGPLKVARILSFILLSLGTLFELLAS